MSDGAPFEVTSGFRRFRQKFDVFNRASWDPEISTPKAKEFFASYFTDRAPKRSAEGFEHRDYALRNASWYLADVGADQFEESEDRKEGFLDTYSLLRPGAEHRREATASQNTQDVKRAAKFLGADLVGICAFDPRWVYSHNFSRLRQVEKPMDLPDDLPYVVVIANEMDYGTLKTVPSALSGASVGQGYSKDIASVLALAAFIQNLGYRAVASLNDTALSIPLAIQAGLGECGRHGMLITREFGPRVRLAKVFTDLPLIADQPRPFGVAKFCEVCRRCANECPPKAIPHDAPSFRQPSISCLVGVKKWTVDPEKCFKFWASQGTDCSICIRVCPYNKDYRNPVFRLARDLANSPLRKAMSWLDKRLGFGKRTRPRRWWAG